jgi:type IV pilus assembly protein PilF
LSARHCLRLTGLLLPVLLAAGCASSQQAGYSTSPTKASQFNAELGAKYMQAGNLQRADAKLREALDQDPDNASAHAAYALLNMRLDKPEKARDHFRTALDHEPDDPQLHNNYGTFLCDQGEYRAGIEQFLKSARNKLYDAPAYAYANAGRCAREAEKFDSARQHFNKALELNPKAPSALIGRAALEQQRGRAQQAKRYFKRYNEVAEATPASLWLGIRIERALGNRAAVRAYGVELLKNFRDSPEAERFLETRQ